MHFHLHNHFIVLNSRHVSNVKSLSSGGISLQFWCELREVAQLHTTYTKTARAVTPEDGHLIPKTCRGFNPLTLELDILSLAYGFRKM
jgi:hypothetical protein